MPLPGQFVVVAGLPQREELECARAAAQCQLHSNCDRVRTRSLGRVETPRPYQGRIEIGCRVGVLARVPVPAGQQRSRFDARVGRSNQRFDRLLGFIDQLRPLQYRRGRGCRHRFRQVAREARFTSRERRTSPALDQFRREQSPATQPVERGITGRRHALRNIPLGNDQVCEPVGTVERDARGVRAAACGDRIVDVRPVHGKIIVPALAHGERHQPLAAQRLPRGLVSIGVEEGPDRRRGGRVVQPAPQPGPDDIGIERVGAQGVAVRGGRARGAAVRRRICGEELPAPLGKRIRTHLGRPGRSE